MVTKIYSFIKGVRKNRRSSKLKGIRAQKHGGRTGGDVSQQTALSRGEGQRFRNTVGEETGKIVLRKLECQKKNVGHDLEMTEVSEKSEENKAAKVRGTEKR